jgi:hypothetical protein
MVKVPKSLYFCNRKFKTHIKMDTHKSQYRRYIDYSVDLYSQSDDAENRLLRGRALLNTKKGELSFVENAPRGPRSVEIGRTFHSRFVRRPDGGYTVTLRVSAMNPIIREELLSEVRDVCRGIMDDVARVKGGKK